VINNFCFGFDEFIVFTLSVSCINGGDKSSICCKIDQKLKSPKNRLCSVSWYCSNKFIAVISFFAIICKAWRCVRERPVLGAGYSSNCLNIASCKKGNIEVSSCNRFS